MAIYHLSAKVIQRSQGRSAIAAAAYRAAEALHDETLGRTFNYLDKPGVVHSEILLPEGAPTRWLDRATLWNEAQQIERRKDAVLAREVELALPRELSQAEAIALARDYAREQFVARGMVADLNIHWGHAADGEAQPHAHIMLTMRRVVPGPAGHPEGSVFGLKERAWNDKALLRGWRARWAELVNARLAEAGFEGQVDHRSNAARGIDLEPQNKIGPAGARRDVRGEDAERAAEHRAIARRNGDRLLAEPELALQALTRQQSTFTRADLARLVHRQSDGAAQFAAIVAKVEASPELVRIGRDGRGRERFSTREMVAVEQRLIATAAALNQRTRHRVNDKRREGVINGKRRQLSAEQVLAYLHVTRSRDLAMVVGIAGGGKSTMLGAARQVWEGEGYRVRGAALSGIAAESLEGSAGIQSRTIASWEYAWEQGKDRLSAADVLVVDEAGMIGSRQLARLITHAYAVGAKLVLVGDAEQLQAIEAGAAFRAVAERVGVIAITEPRRQLTDWQRLATRELATARTDAALDRYETAGLVQRHATREAARAGVIASWQAARALHPEQSQLILAHERVDVRALNAAARAVRRAAGELGPDRVLETEAGPQAFAEGDRVYFLRNERGLGVKNGTLGTLRRIEGGRLTVRLDSHGAPGPAGAGSGGDVVFDLADYADLGHGYAATIHKNQGATVDQAHVLATPGMDRHLTYVAMSRHRHAARLHWSEEDFGAPARLRELLGRERAKDTTLDYAEPELDLVAAYAERRGINPLAPASEIVADEPGRPRMTARGKLRRAQLGPALRSVLAGLQALIERQTAAAGTIAAAAVRESTPDIQPPRVEGYDEAAIRIIENMPPPRPRPRDHVVPSEPAAPSAPPDERIISDISRMLEAALEEAESHKPPAEPMIPAVPYRPATDAEAAAFLKANGITQVQSRVPELLEQAYRDPVLATTRLSELVRVHGVSGAASLLESRGPGLLGKLRGREGLLASERTSEARFIATHVASRLPDALLEPERVRASNLEIGRRHLQETRQRSAIAVPGLSKAARAALERLRQAGAEQSALLLEGPGRLSDADAARAARVAATWQDIARRPDPRVRNELLGFAEAAHRRLAGWGETEPHPATSAVRDLADVLAATEQLIGRYHQLEAARAEARQQAAQAERKAQAEATRRAEAEATIKEWSRHHKRGAQPSRGPSMGG